MNYGTPISIALGLVLSSQVTIAGPVTDTFTAGDVLTAAKMDNIKTAINDNNTASRFYGDGSAGELTIASNTNWSLALPDGNNFNFTNVVIDAGTTLHVPAGTVIRCSGSFINNGSIAVDQVGNNEFYLLLNKDADWTHPPGKGDARTAARPPQGHNTLGVELGAGEGGKGIRKAVAASAFNGFKIGGGASSGFQRGAAGSGGGLLKIYCAGGISNNGAITANGGSGSNNSGGGGGIIILASSTSVTNNTGSLEALGGEGQDSDRDSGAAGGGGGGIIVLAAPSISNSGSTDISGGIAGSGGTTITFTPYSAGGGGGASGGKGGRGGRISSSNLAEDNASPGTDGYVLEIRANPAHMM